MGIIWFFAHLPNALVALMLVLLQFLVGSETYSDWVWRVPFLVGGLIGVIGFWIVEIWKNRKSTRTQRKP